MKQFILLGFILIVCFSSCKKKDPIPNPLYGEWRLTEWIFEGRDISDSIDVIWGVEHKLFFTPEFVTFGSDNPVSLKSEEKSIYVGIYKFKTDDLKYIGISLKNRDNTIVDSLISERYALIGIDGDLLPAEIFFKTENEFMIYIIVGGSQLNFIKL